MLLPIARVAVAAVVGSVTYNTGRNVYETVNIVAKQPLPSQQTLPQSVSDLQKLSRKEIIHLYLNDCTALPSDLTNMEGEWNGTLLNNNGLTRITKFITNRLFGKNRRWNGKEFHEIRSRTIPPLTPTTSVDDTLDTILFNDSNDDALINDGKSGTGWNRFEVLTQYRTSTKKQSRRNKRQSSKSATPTKSTTVILKTEKEHCFEYRIDTSRLHPHESSICLDYTNHQGIFSLWKGMKDEIRVLPTESPLSSLSSSSTTDQISSNNNKYDVLIGLGSMNWSGGIYNCSPFCLYRKK